MEYKRLEEVCTLITDGTHQTPTYTDTGYIFLSSKNVTSGKIDWENVKYVSKELHEELSKRVIPKKNDILLAKNGTTGVAAIVDKDISFDIYVSLALLRPKEEINPKYLLRVINSQYTKRKFDKRLKGIGVKNLHLKEIKDITIPIPSIEIQKRIVEVLDKAQSLIDKKKEQIELLDELVKSRFIEMFGNPISNSKLWKKEELGEICDVRDGTHDSPKYVNDGYPLITSKNITNGKIDFENVNLISKEDLENINKRSKVDNGDIIMPMIGTIGNPIIVNTNIEFAIKNVALIKFKEERVNNIFIKSLLESDYFEILISKNKRGGTQKFISLGNIRKLEIILPPIELQNEFAEFVEQTDSIRSKMEASLSELEDNFNSLMQKAFKGELFN